MEGGRVARASKVAYCALRWRECRQRWQPIRNYTSSACITVCLVFVRDQVRKDVGMGDPCARIYVDVEWSVGCEYRTAILSPGDDDGANTDLAFVRFLTRTLEFFYK